LWSKVKKKSVGWLGITIYITIAVVLALITLKIQNQVIKVVIAKNRNDKVYFEKVSNELKR